MLVLNGMLTHFRWNVNIFREARGLVCTIMNKMNQTQLSGNKLIPALFLPGITFDKYLNKSFPVWYAESLHIPVPKYFLSLHFSSTYTRLLAVTAGNRTLPHLGRQPWGFSWQGPALVTGLAPVTGLFKNVFGVTEIPTTCTTHISAMPLC